MPSIPVNSMKRGNTILHDGTYCQVISTDHVKPGKGPAYVQAKLKRVPEGGVVEVRFNSSAKVNQVMVIQEKYTYSYDAGSSFVFMNSETFDELHFPREGLEDRILYLKSGDEVSVDIIDDKPMGITLPKIVVHEIAETPPAIKGATATNQLKPATTETGLNIKVPPFIATGELVRIDTESGSYVDRAKS